MMTRMIMMIMTMTVKVDFIEQGYVVSLLEAFWTHSILILMIMSMMIIIFTLIIMMIKIIILINIEQGYVVSLLGILGSLHPDE